jgi:uncharacterized LabA/DUF88 family protein
MNHDEIRNFLSTWEPLRERTIVIVDFGNVEKWKESLGFPVGVRELARLTKVFSYGKRPLRRFYYGADYGKSEKSVTLSAFSAQILNSADMNGFEVIEKRVKYIHNPSNTYGYEKKCDLDVEMVVDLIEERENYDHIVLFSGDGDLVRALEYLHKEYRKRSTVMSARGHISREIIDANRSGIIDTLLYAEDFAHRLQFRR